MAGFMFFLSSKCVHFRVLNYSESSEPEMEIFTVVLLHLELSLAESASAQHMFRLLFSPKGKTCIHNMLKNL